MNNQEQIYLSSSVAAMPEEVRDVLKQSLINNHPPAKYSNFLKVGREKEDEYIENVLDRIHSGVPQVRMVLGEIGYGKSFFLDVTKQIAHNKNLITMRAELSEESKVLLTTSKLSKLYKNLIDSMTTKDNPEENKSLLSVLLDNAAEIIRGKAGNDPKAIKEYLLTHYRDIKNMSPSAFFNVFSQYVIEGADNRELRESILSWFKGENVTKTEAKRAGIKASEIVTDENYFDFLKILAVFVKHCGFDGILIQLDEAASLSKIKAKVSREKNYSRLLNMGNDLASKTNMPLGIFMYFTPNEFKDKVKGVYSLDSLQTRYPAASNKFITSTSTVLPLMPLTTDEKTVLLEKIADLLHTDYPHTTHEDIEAFMSYISSGSRKKDYESPRTFIAAFLKNLALAKQQNTTVVSYLASNENTDLSEDYEEEIF